MCFHSWGIVDMWSQVPTKHCTIQMPFKISHSVYLLLRKSDDKSSGNRRSTIHYTEDKSDRTLVISER